MDLIRADSFTLEQLTSAYNDTRTDYIVPMPMNVPRLREYIHLFDIDLGASWVVTKNDTIYGLGMLGVRFGRAWITRVGVLPWGRRQGIGRSIIDKLIDSARVKGLETVWLEVISGNNPAYQLFVTSGFQKTRELLVARRAPQNETSHQSKREQTLVTELNRDQILALLDRRTTRPNWINETETYRKLSDLRGLCVQLPGGNKGWICYEVSFLQINRIVVDVVAGDAEQVTFAMLQALHERHPTQDAILENLPAYGPIWPGFKEMEYFDVFRRVEMVRKC